MSDKLNFYLMHINKDTVHNTVIPLFITLVGQSGKFNNQVSSFSPSLMVDDKIVFKWQD